MFTSELPLTLEIPDGDDPQIIQYVNALPGAGKTWTFDNRVAKPHVSEDHNSLLVYAAPTSKLLQERERSLLDLGIHPSKIMVLTSDTIPRGITVGEAFREAVTGRSGKKGRPNGTIVLCTHECVARVPESMRGRDRVVLVYDEARACLQDNYALHLPDEVYSYLIEPRDHHTDDGRKIRTCLLSPVAVSVSERGDDSESVYIWKWSNYLLPLPTSARLQELLPRSTRRSSRAEGILDFLRNIHSSSLDVYVSITRKKKSAEYVVSNVFSPSRMFRGYGKVLILSAFFESSQMYQFLARSRRTDGSATELKDITRQMLDRKRMVLLLKRMARARLTYIYDLGTRTLSKSDMQQALVVESPLESEVVKKINAKWHELYPLRPEFYRTVHSAYLEQSAGQALRMTDDGREPAYRLMRHLDTRFGIWGGVVPHMVETSIKLQQAFLTHLKMPIETLPIGINPRYTSYAEGESEVWKAEQLDKLNQRTAQFKKPKKGPIIMQLPITAHGLNAYKELHSCAFLAAMKYSPRESKFMDRTLPEYDTEIDRTLDYALQLLWRCNVRMPTQDPVLLIVTDKQLAIRLQERFRTLADFWLKEKLNLLPIVSPQRLVKDYKTPSLLRYTFNTAAAQKVRDATYKSSVKGQEFTTLKKIYLSTSEGALYNRLSSSISYAKRKGKEYASLEAERRGLQTFAQWRKSEAGIAARSPTKNKNWTAEIKTALTALDFSKIKSRDERLKIMSAIKNDHPELKEHLRSIYPGDKFDHNWKTAEVYGSRYNRGWILAKLKEQDHGLNSK